MAESKDSKDPGFFRKVVRFVANPTTDWADLNSRQGDETALELEKTELKAMIERKKRNDFVRKREFDMLRKVRREGLTPEQLAALGGSSRLDDSDGRQSEGVGGGARVDAGVKAKIDEIEQQMVGGVGGGARRTVPGRLSTRSASFGETTTAPAVLAMPPRLTDAADGLPALPPLAAAERAAAQVASGAGLSPLAPAARGSDPLAATGAQAIEVSEVVHDPELDEAVIAFANADFAQCEQALTRLTAIGGTRAQHAETWLVLFDFYRATGQQARFEGLVLDYVQQFGWSAPQWFSLPRLVADAAAAAAAQAEPGRRAIGDVGWRSPEVLDADAVATLNSLTLQMPLPWVFDWSQLRQIEAQAATELGALMRQWAPQPLEMRWIAGERLFAALAEAAPSGVRDADPAFWTARLDALKLANRADQFEEAAIDYCVTYEVSPPSWERPRANVRIANSLKSTTALPLTQASEVTTSFVESSMNDVAAGAVKVATVELSGQLVGDIGPTLGTLDQQLGDSALVTVSCTRLIRVDFVAAGDLLNWVLAKRGENRAVQFADAHRLVALFFGAMGINEHAQVRLRNI
jgi:hypothetical protein